MKTHGSHASYAGGCRCQECKRGHADYMAMYRASKPAKDALAKRYPKVNVTEPPVTREDWLKLDASAFWFWMALHMSESGVHIDSGPLHI